MPVRLNCERTLFSEYPSRQGVSTRLWGGLGCFHGARSRFFEAPKTVFGKMCIVGGDLVPAPWAQFVDASTHTVKPIVDIAKENSLHLGTCSQSA